VLGAKVLGRHCGHLYGRVETAGLLSLTV
jgi:hypothetical protein